MGNTPYPREDTDINYCRLSNRVQWETHHTQEEHARKMAASVKQQLLWFYVQYKTRTESGICDPTYFKNNTKLSTTKDKKKEVLTSFLSSMFTSVPTSEVIPSLPCVETTFCDKILFNHNAVYKNLFNLLQFKSLGPDKLHPFVLKSQCDIVCKLIAISFQTSLDTMSLPNI